MELPNVIFIPFVAPFAGAWIEIHLSEHYRIAKNVAPFAGAWIEIFSAIRSARLSRVAPFAGAWIEIPSFWRVKN